MAGVRADGAQLYATPEVLIPCGHHLACGPESFAAGSGFGSARLSQPAVLPTIQRLIGTPRMVAWGVVAPGVAFVVLVPPALWSDGHRVSMAWLVACMTLMILGELLVAPLGLSMILRLTPPRFIGVVFGSWYVAGALGYWLSGELGAGWLRLAGP